MYVSRNFLLFVSNNSLWRFSVDANLIQREIDKAVNSIEYKHEPQLNRKFELQKKAKSRRSSTPSNKKLWLMNNF